MSAEQREHQGDPIPLLPRRAGPTPELSIIIPIPESPQPEPDLLGYVQFNDALTSELEPGSVYEEIFSSSPTLMEEELRTVDRADLQTSGDAGWNDYLHWYRKHPDGNAYPRMSWDECSCPREEDEEIYCEAQEAPRQISPSCDHWPSCSHSSPEMTSIEPGVHRRQFSPKLKRDLIICLVTISTWLLIREVIGILPF